MKKHFLGIIYGKNIWMESETEDEVRKICQLLMKSINGQRRNFWERLKYLFTN